MKKKILILWLLIRLVFQIILIILRGVRDLLMMKGRGTFSSSSISSRKNRILMGWRGTISIMTCYRSRAMNSKISKLE